MSVKELLSQDDTALLEAIRNRMQPNSNKRDSIELELLYEEAIARGLELPENIGG